MDALRALVTRKKPKAPEPPEPPVGIKSSVLYTSLDGPDKTEYKYLPGVSVCHLQPGGWSIPEPRMITYTALV